MKNTTVCYIEKDNAYLLIHRNKKENDENQDKWIGVGGKFLENESPEECMLREVKEETNLDLLNYRYCGIVTFVSNIYESQLMHLFKADKFVGNLSDCDEGTLEWINKDVLLTKNLWEGDKIFLKLLDESSDFFSLKLVYEYDDLVSAILNGNKIK